MAKIAKLFFNGRSQAVRLPKEYRFRGTEVRISGFWDAFAPDPEFEIPSPLPTSDVDLDAPG